MFHQFFEHPILNSPYAHPSRHWELDPDRQPTGSIAECRRPSSYVTPVPKSSRRRSGRGQKEILQFEDISTPEHFKLRDRLTMTPVGRALLKGCGPKAEHR